MSDPAAILATSGAIRTLVDGTLRLTVDIDPKDAQVAFALFGRPGSPVALARITNAAAVAHDRPKHVEPADRKPLSLASKVALTCREKSFSEFLGQPRFDQARTTALVIVSERASIDSERHGYFEPQEAVVEMVRRLCGVESRSEIVPGSEAARRWSTLEADYHHWQRTGAAA